jgi:adenylate cyclase
MGYGHTTQITAVGDAVNTASRLETLTKTYDCELVVSDSVIAAAGLDRSLFHWHEIEPRGKQQTIAVAVLESARELPPPAGAAPAQTAAAPA